MPRTAEVTYSGGTQTEGRWHKYHSQGKGRAKRIQRKYSAVPRAGEGTVLSPNPAAAVTHRWLHPGSRAQPSLVFELSCLDLINSLLVVHGCGHHQASHTWRLTELPSSWSLSGESTWPHDWDLVHFPIPDWGPALGRASAFGHSSPSFITSGAFLLSRNWSLRTILPAHLI